MRRLDDVLSGAGVRLLVPSSTQPRGRTVAWEQGVPLPHVDGGLLLTPGVRGLPVSVVVEAAAQGYAAVFVKAFGADLADLVAGAQRADVALFVVVDDDLDWLQLASLLTSVQRASNDTASAVPVGDLFALANSIAAATGGATAIEDGESRILAYSTLPDQPIDEDRRLSILGRAVPNEPENAVQYREVYDAPGVLHVPPLPAGGYPRLAVPVRAGSHLVGSIWVIDAGMLSPHAEDYLADITSVATLHLLRSRSDRDLARQMRADVVEGILDGSMAPREGVRRLGMPLTGPFRVITLAPADDSALSGPGLLQSADLASVVLETHFAGVALLQRGPQIHILVAGDAARERGHVEDAVRHIVEQAASTLALPLHAALGPALRRPDEIPGAARNTDRVLDLLRRQRWRGPIASTRALENELALADVDALFRARPELLGEAAKDVVAHDRAKQTHYAELLVTWCEARYDVGVTAQRMATHPNTVRYRLGKVSSLFGLDVHDPDALLLTWLSLRALGASSASS